MFGEERAPSILGVEMLALLGSRESVAGEAEDWLGRREGIAGEAPGVLVDDGEVCHWCMCDDDGALTDREE